MRNFNDNRRTGGRSQGRSSMHQATCSDCGKSCEVPFKPTGDKPVYCNECFKNADKSGGRDRGRRENSGFRTQDSRLRFTSDGQAGVRSSKRGRPDFGDKKMHRATCSDCGKSCEVPFKPTGDKPVYCDDCFGGSKGRDFKSKKPDQSGGQFEQLNKKLDKVLKILETMNPKKTFVIEKPAVETQNFASTDEMMEKKPKKKPKKKTPAKKAVKKTAKKAPAKKKGKKAK